MATTFEEKSRIGKVRENLSMVFPSNRDRYKAQVRTDFLKSVATGDITKNLGNQLDILEYKLKFRCKVSEFFSIVCFFNNIDFDFDDYCNNTLKKLGANCLTCNFLVSKELKLLRQIKHC